MMQDKKEKKCEDLKRFYFDHFIYWMNSNRIKDDFSISAWGVLILYKLYDEYNNQVKRVSSKYELLESLSEEELFAAIDKKKKQVEDKK